MPLEVSFHQNKPKKYTHKEMSADVKQRILLFVTIKSDWKDLIWLPRFSENLIFYNTLTLDYKSIFNTLPLDYKKKYDWYNNVQIIQSNKEIIACWLKFCLDFYL